MSQCKKLMSLLLMVSSFAMHTLVADGSPVITFGNQSPTNGLFYSKLSTSFLNGAAIQSAQQSNRIVGIGYQAIGNYFLQGLTSSGISDSSFSGGFINGTAIAGVVLNAVLLLADDSVIAVGTASAQALVAKYSPTGALQTSFGNQSPTSGYLIVPTPTGVIRISLNAVALQPDGKIVAGGFIVTGAATAGLYLIRFTSVGVLDPSFGTNGVVTFDASSVVAGATYAQVSALAIQPGATAGSFNIIIGGYVTTSGNQFFVGSLNAAGAVNSTTFSPGGAAGKNQGQPGFFSLNSGFLENTVVNALAIDESGNIVYGGTSLDGLETFTTWLIGRLTSAGALDTSFTSNGYFATYPAMNVTTIQSGVQALLIQPVDQNIVALGFGGITSSSVPQPIAARFLTATGALDSSFGSSANGLQAGFEDYSALLASTSLANTGAAFFAGSFQPDGDVVGWGAGAPVLGGGNPGYFAINFSISGNEVNPTTLSSPTATTNSSPVTYSGTAQSLSAIGAILDGAIVGNTNVSADAETGSWTISPVPVGDGTHRALSVAWYAAGNLNVSADPVTFTLGSGPTPPKPPAPCPGIPVTGPQSQLSELIQLKYCCP